LRKELSISESELVETNHLHGRLLDDYDKLQEQLRLANIDQLNTEAELASVRRDLEAEYEGSRTLRIRYGAKDTETFHAFVGRLATELKHAQVDLAAAQAENARLRGELSNVECDASFWRDRADLLARADNAGMVEGLYYPEDEMEP
jgi:outer membrane murein-binding lipoprotein Lpp